MVGFVNVLSNMPHILAILSTSETICHLLSGTKQEKKPVEPLCAKALRAFSLAWTHSVGHCLLDKMPPK
jgi:hypothetical protein